MSATTSVLTRAHYGGSTFDTRRDLYVQRGTMTNAVTVEDDSIILDPRLMKVGQYYSVELDGKPYLYRKTSDSEIEMYGLAGED